MKHFGHVCFCLVLKIRLCLTTKLNSKISPHSSPERKSWLLFGEGYGQQNFPWKLNFKMADVVIRSCGFRVFLPSCCRAWSGVRQLKTTAKLHKGDLYFYVRLCCVL